MLCSKKKVGDTNFCKRHLREKSDYQRGYTEEIRRKRAKRAARKQEKMQALAA
jgi:hypothetical protein